VLENSSPPPRPFGDRAGGYAQQEQPPDTRARRAPQASLDTETRATWGERPPPRRMVLHEWRRVRKNTLRGFANVELPSGLVIRDVSIHEKGGKWWASPPSRPMLNAEGRQIRNHAGHAQYAALRGWHSRELGDRFSAAVVELIRREHPSDLDEAGGEP
jgi:hypothetical protein